MVSADERASFAVASDGTRLFVRTRERRERADEIPGHLRTRERSERADEIPGRVRTRERSERTDEIPGHVHTRERSERTEGVHALLSDGILCDGFIWKYLWDDLAPLIPLVHWHYRGHGRSAPPADPKRIDIAAHADDLDSVRRHVGDPPCVLFGHSMGCQVALEAYRKRPDKIRGLVLLCGSFGNVTSTFHGIPVLQLILPKLLELAQNSPHLVRALWSRLPPQLALKIALKAGEIDPERVHPEDILPYLSHMTHVDFPMFLQMLRAAGEHTAGDILARIDVPVLVVAGERDTFTPPFLATAMTEAIPQGEILMVPRGTHVTPIEQPGLVDARIKQFLNERVLGAHG